MFGHKIGKNLGFRISGQQFLFSPKFVHFLSKKFHHIQTTLSSTFWPSGHRLAARMNSRGENGRRIVQIGGGWTRSRAANGRRWTLMLLIIGRAKTLEIFGTNFLKESKGKIVEIKADENFGYSFNINPLMAKIFLNLICNSNKSRFIRHQIL